MTAAAEGRTRFETTRFDPRGDELDPEREAVVFSAYGLGLSDVPFVAASGSLGQSPPVYRTVVGEVALPRSAVESGTTTNQHLSGHYFRRMWPEVLIALRRSLRGQGSLPQWDDGERLAVLTFVEVLRSAEYVMSQGPEYWTPPNTLPPAKAYNLALPGYPAVWNVVLRRRDAVAAARMAKEWASSRGAGRWRGFFDPQFRLQAGWSEAAARFLPS